ncbi:hypothetical protein [Nocardiopsis potens]|uniref:hypothetical protein n=1 Tax=Nocardiopsis potens TaxID=1246458 RepID=UPI000344D89B|nr:hypothetical protein [Nocardiopsis potens]
MSSMLLIVAGCALACAWSLWIVVGSHGEKRSEKRNDVLTHSAAVAAGGGAGMTLIALVTEWPESTGARVFSVVLAGYVLVCAACVWATDHVDEARHRIRIRDLLDVAMWTAAGAAFLALAGALTDPGVREAVGGAADAVGAVLEGLLTLVAVAVTVVVTLGFVILIDGEDRNAPRRPKGMSRQVWNRQQREWREYKRRYGTDRSGGAGYSGGSGGGSGGDGGGFGDGGDGGD